MHDSRGSKLGLAISVAQKRYGRFTTLVGMEVAEMPLRLIQSHWRYSWRDAALGYETTEEAT
jgi:hypothetical protein